LVEVSASECAALDLWGTVREKCVAPSAPFAAAERLYLVACGPAAFRWMRRRATARLVLLMRPAIVRLASARAQGGGGESMAGCFRSRRVPVALRIHHFGDEEGHQPIAVMADAPEPISIH